ncbi:MAG: pentapeptide repeat-containing protein, partial [Planctomycetota bacterium]|nr:pentapeptide repeat-containing protein [Planctomycetota bacterium]
MKLFCLGLFTFTICTCSFADIYQYADCDGDENLLLTEIDPEPYVDLSNMYLSCAELTGENLEGANLEFSLLVETYLSFAELTGANLEGANLSQGYL